VLRSVAMSLDGFSAAVQAVTWRVPGSVITVSARTSRVEYGRRGHSAHTSMVYMSGSQLDFNVDALRTMNERGIATFEVRADAQKSLHTALDAQMNGTVWNSGCGSWYLDDTGRNTTLWPDWTWRYRQLTNHFDPDSYLLTRSSASSTVDGHQTS